LQSDAEKLAASITAKPAILLALGTEENRRGLCPDRAHSASEGAQRSPDRRLLRFQMTMQKVSVLLRCVEARRISPGQLAVARGRDKGKMTRYIDSLQSRRLLVREINQRDRCSSILKPTAKGKRAAQELTSVFDDIRKELFAGILEVMSLG
jgi:DNA-binding MarR family transcriptional regulator